MLERIEYFGTRDIEQLARRYPISPESLFEMKVVSAVLPFRTNNYVLEKLIDWESGPSDPIYQMTFPQRGMLSPHDFHTVATLLRNETGTQKLQDVIKAIRQSLNPHPGDQLSLNVPRGDGVSLDGVQHKYPETVLYFPSAGQTCHSYCSFCFRWAQFVGDSEYRIASQSHARLHEYLVRHAEVTDLLLTGGDPMVMKTEKLEQILEPLLAPQFDHIQSIRIGTKALTYWPYRFTQGNDADALLHLIEKLVHAGKHVSIMAHFNHWRELDGGVVADAVQKLQGAGALIRSQGPVLRCVNDSADVWRRMWKTQVAKGIAPYYMFVERDTGASRYFEVPLTRAWDIYNQANNAVSGLGRTARGPSMSASPGKIEITAVTTIRGQKVFALRYLQARDRARVGQVFFAKYDPNATWYDQLVPAFEGQEEHFEWGKKEAPLGLVGQIKLVKS